MNLSEEPLLELTLTVAPPLEVANRRCIAITGGTVTGRYIGKVLAGGADWQTIGADGTIEIEARYLLELSEGRVEIRSTGLRSGPPEVLARLAKGENVDPAAYYFRTMIRFSTAAPGLTHLNRIIGLARGERRPDSVRIIIHEVC